MNVYVYTALCMHHSPGKPQLAGSVLILVQGFDMRSFYKPYALPSAQPSASKHCFMIVTNSYADAAE